MGNAISAAVSALCASMSAVHMVSLLQPPPGASTTTTPVAAEAPPPLHSGVWDLLLLASAAGFSGSVIFMYRHRAHLHRGRAGGNRRQPEIVSFMLFVCAGLLQFFMFVQAPAPGGADVDHGEQARRALGLAALRVLPAVATVTYFLGTILIVAAHIRAGGEGGGGDVAVAAGEEPVQASLLGLVRLLSRMALAAAAGLVCLMAVAVYGAHY